MPAELEIVLDVARYRLRRLEMANLVAAVAIMLALRLPVAELAVRFAFGVLLNLFVYLNNDYFDRDDDAGAVGRDADKNAYLRAHRGAAARAQLGLAGVLVGFALVWDAGLLRALVLGGGICVAYSASLKHHPGFDVLAMIAWGAAMPLVGVPPGAADGWALVGQLALFSGVFESIQVLRDREVDMQAGIRTTAVALGAARTRVLVRLLLVSAAIYTAAAFHPVLAALPLMAVALPIPSQDLGAYWNRVRMLLGLTFVAECALVFARGGG